MSNRQFAVFATMFIVATGLVDTLLFGQTLAEALIHPAIFVATLVVIRWAR